MAMCQGRGNALLIIMSLAISSVLLCEQLSNAAVYTVGDSSMWTLSSIDYNRWAQSKPIRENDVLKFLYLAEIHNVLLVSKTDYDQCSSSNPLAVYANGYSLVELTRSGTYYFICGVAGHCQGGMKMAVIVP